MPVLFPASCSLPAGKEGWLSRYIPGRLVRIGFMYAPCRSVDVRKSLSLFHVDADSTNKKAAR